jgi:hypothetical protein
MIKKLSPSTHVLIALSGLLFCADLGKAQYFAVNKGDLLAGFRKTGSFAGNYELVVNLGNITNFEAVSRGLTIVMTNFTPAQLSAAFSSYNNLQWSVSAAFSGSSAWAGFPASTLWYTVPRSAAGSQSQPPLRDIASNQQQTRQRIVSLAAGATSISTSLGSTNANNNSVLVRESTGDPNALTAFIGDPSDSTFGDFQGTLPFTVENTTPASFTCLARADLYQACPTATTDPVTQLTEGNAYLVGYFDLNSNGTMSFTRASSGGPPPAPVLSITRNGNVNMISFHSTNGATYTVSFTNATGFNTPVTNWPSNPCVINGNNSMVTYQETTSDPVRFYSVHAQ